MTDKTNVSRALLHAKAAINEIEQTALALVRHHVKAREVPTHLADQLFEAKNLLTLTFNQIERTYDYKLLELDAKKD